MRRSPKSTNTEEVKFSLRLTKDVYDAIRVAAEVEKRSINSQVVLILEQWVVTHNGPPFGD